MWSDRYYYLNIYKDKDLSEAFSLPKFNAFMTSVPELKVKSDRSYENVISSPFVSLFTLQIKNTHSYSSFDFDINKFNFISIVCAKGNEVDFDVLLRVFIKIASFLQWHLIDEYTDDDIENYVLWKP